MMVNEGSQNLFRITAGEDMRLRNMTTQSMYYGQNYNTKYKSTNEVCLPKNSSSKLV